jgi:CelD/BcsL family acetyltransferase involved in cellulose biosynthesis
MSEYIISTFHSFESCEAIWRSFEKTANLLVFQSYDWLHGWYKIIGKNQGVTLNIVLVQTNNNKHLLLLPFGIKKKNGITRLEWLGGIISDYGAPILVKNIDKFLTPEDFLDLWKHIMICLPLVDVISFVKQPETINSEINPFTYLSTETNPDCSYEATLPGSWEEYYAKRIKKRIQADSRRQTKRLEKLGNLRIRVVENEDEIDRVTTTMIKQKRHRYKMMHVTDMFVDEKYRTFYKNLAQNNISKGFVHLSVIMLDDRILATHWGLVYQRRFYYLMPSYEDGEWAKYSAGRLLLEFLIRWAIENGHKTFDFTIGGEEYKKIWCDNEIVLYEWNKAQNIKGLLFKAVLSSKARLRKITRLFNLVKKIVRI